MSQVESLPTVTSRVAVGPPRAPTSVRTGALLAAGAYDPVTWIELPMGIERVSLLYIYTLVGSTIGSASMRPAFQQADIGTTPFRDVEVGSVTVGTLVIQKALKESQIDTPIPPATSISDVVVLRVPPGMTHIAIPAAESGDPTNPGTLALWIATGV
jgi:hypothetical protein